MGWYRAGALPFGTGSLCRMVSFTGPAPDMTCHGHELEVAFRAMVLLCSSRGGGDESCRTGKCRVGSCLIG